MQNFIKLPQKFVVVGNVYEMEIKTFWRINIVLLLLMPFSETKRHRHFDNVELNIGWGYFSFHRRKKTHSIQNRSSKPKKLLSFRIFL